MSQPGITDSLELTNIRFKSIKNNNKSKYTVILTNEDKCIKLCSDFTGFRGYNRFLKLTTIYDNFFFFFKVENEHSDLTRE